MLLVYPDYTDRDSTKRVSGGNYSEGLKRKRHLPWTANRNRAESHSLCGKLFPVSYEK